MMPHHERANGTVLWRRRTPTKPWPTPTPWSTSAPIAQVPPGFRWPSPSAPAWRRSAANTYPGLTKSQGGTPGEPHSETAPLYVIREAGVIVDLACEPPHAMDPAKHALILLHALMRD